MHRHAGPQQGCRVDVPQIMKPGVRKQLADAALAHGHVVSLIKSAISDDTVSG